MPSISKTTSSPWKTAIVSGGGTGLGRSLAILLAQEGYKVGILARSEEPLQKVCSEISEQNGHAYFRVSDVNDPENLQKAINELVSELGGRLDLMVINAAMINYSKEDRAPNEKVRQLFETNIMGSVSTIHAVVPQMLKQGHGQIVGISSIGAFQSWPGGGLRYYYTSKKCMSLILGTYGRHLRSQGIHISIMHPGWIETAMFDANRILAKKRYVDTPDSAALKIVEAIRERRNRVFPFALFLKIQRQNLSKSAKAVIHKILGKKRNRRSRS